MKSKTRRTRRWMVCPSCKTAVRNRSDRAGKSACPRCGELLVGLRRILRAPSEDLDCDDAMCIDESREWERLLLEDMN
jgi:predicted RNA-binding Zn-ribbon protein involved in translation (DUF1610 family)